MTFSAIIPTKNRVDLTLRAISSCLEIDLINEIIVIDDGSSLENFQLLIKKIKSENVRVIENMSKPGALSARIFGAKLAKNEIIVFLDSDDILCKETISINFHHINNHSDLGLVYSNVIHGKKQTDWLQVSGFERRLILKNLSLCAFSGMVVRKTYISQCDFILTLPSWQDDEFCLQISKYAKIQFMPGIVAFCSENGARISSSKRRQLDGLGLLLKKYQSDLIENHGGISIIFWKIRLLSLSYLARSEEIPQRYLKNYYYLLGRLLRKFTAVYFDRIYV